MKMSWPQPQLRSPAEVTGINQVKDNGDLDLCGSTGNDKKWWDSGLILKAELTDFAGNL